MQGPSRLVGHFNNLNAVCEKQNIKNQNKKQKIVRQNIAAE